MFFSNNLMRYFLNQLISGESLTYEDSLKAIRMIAEGLTNPAQASAFLMGIQQKGITSDELAGFRQGMLEKAIDIGLEEIPAMDVCGTGGDGKDTFNISTTSAFITAGAGVKIAKHGNHGVSSSVGSSTVLEYLGIKFTNNKDYLRKKLENAGICYLHAPLFHPAMKSVATIRKDLGFRTFFNILGPLLNPAKVKVQLTGVSDLKTFDLYKNLFAKSEGRYSVIHALDGYDEISLTGDFRAYHHQEDQVFSPASIGLKQIKPDQLLGGASLKESAEILIKILKNQGTKAQTEAVIANAGLAISTYKNISFMDGIAEAKDSLESGRAFKSLKLLVED